MLEPLNAPVINWSGAVPNQQAPLPSEFILGGWLYAPINRASEPVRVFVNGEEIDPNAWVQLELQLEGN